MLVLWTVASLKRIFHVDEGLVATEMSGDRIVSVAIDTEW
jgi:hypothetical protein